MGLLSSLFGDKNPEDSVLGTLAGLVDSAVDAAKNAAASITEAPAAPAAQSFDEDEEPLSGESWGEEMPDEPNQFNFPGTYREYFMQVFTEAFPEYRIECEDLRGGEAQVITFYAGSEPALKVELLGRSSCAYSLRKRCAEAGLPYLRFYYNVDGWWNTRAYVEKRARAALGK